MQDGKENIEAIFIIFNVAWIVFCIYVAWIVIRYPGARVFVKDALENGDNKAHHEDATKVIALGGAIGFFWLTVNTIILSLYYGPDTGWYIVIGIEVTTLGGLLGINLKKG